ncbi:MAG: Gram-negative bacterial tonB protein [Bacteroidetes bacterium ADurb.Bin408]|nr:MAG: Gram-negative bacterial tonB protein [Bacteroidetes bacterium ADurb.Bin408]
MKKVVFTLGFVAILCLSSFANTIKPDNIKDVIKKEITYPDFAKKEKIEGVVMVSFSISDGGTVNIDITNASNEDLKSYVVNKLKGLIFRQEESESRYNMKFEFKIQ